MHYILLIIGFVLLIKGANYFVAGSSNLAKYLKVSSLTIGLTIVSFGTSAPETVISTIASIKEANDMAVSNVIGSNLFNLLVVLGGSALIRPLCTKNEVLKRDYIIAITTSIILFIFMCDSFFNGEKINLISRGESIALLICFIFYLYAILLNNSNSKYKKYEYHKLDIVDILMLLSGVLAIILGGDLVVRSAKIISLSWGMSETFVGLTIVSIGTSLPELITSLVAIHKNETDIAIGNAIGSNIYNILFVIGVSGAVSPIFINYYAIIDIVFLIIISFLYYFILEKYKKIDRKTGIIMIITYILFLIYITKR